MSGGGSVDILMYHSIAEAPGPTSIAPQLFEAQILALAASSIPVLRMDDVRDHLLNGQGRACCITFDDGFSDFATAAWPVMRRLGLPAMVYLPTDRIGGTERWTGAHNPPRPLMSWNIVRQLVSEGVDFGNHTATHPDLSAVEIAEVVSEIETARLRIFSEIGQSPVHFAPPYGRSTAEGRRMIAENHSTSVGTLLATATGSSDIYDLPRLEMHYFSSIQRWRAHLEGRGAGYVRLRRALRGIRSKFL